MVGKVSELLSICTDCPLGLCKASVIAKRLATMQPTDPEFIELLELVGNIPEVIEILKREKIFEIVMKSGNWKEFLNRGLLKLSTSTTNVVIIERILDATCGTHSTELLVLLHNVLETIPDGIELKSLIKLLITLTSEDDVNISLVCCALLHKLIRNTTLGDKVSLSFKPDILYCQLDQNTPYIF